MNKFRNLSLLVLGLAAYYISVVYAVGFFTNPAQLIYRFNDTHEYREAADWIFGIVPQSLMIARRTFLYPLVLGSTIQIGGELGIWVLQMILWIASSVLFLQALRNLKIERKYVVIGFVIFLITLTPIYLSTLAITEPLAFFLFCLAAFFCSGPMRPKQIGALLVIAGLAVVVKPNYVMLVTLAVLFGLVVMISKRVSWKLAPWLIAALIPLAIQLELNHHVTGHYALSNIGQHVVKVSLYAEVMDKVTQGGLVPIHNRYMDEQVETAVIFSFLASHPFYTFFALLSNLEENIRTVFELNDNFDRTLHFVRAQLNGLNYWLHIIFFIPTLICFWKARKFKNDDDLRFWLLALFFWGAILPTGISMWSGDRWTAPVIPLWICLYFVIAQRLGWIKKLEPAKT